jgi:hypothetical protein
MTRRIKKSLPYKLNLIFGVLLVALAYFSIFNNLSEQALDFYFNSDALYTTAVYHDLFINKSGLHGWQISPSPYFFPDMPVYFAIYAFTSNIPLSFFIYGIFQLTILVLIFYFIIKALAKEKTPFIFPVFLFLIAIIFLPGIYCNEFIFSFFIFSHSYHFSAFIMALLSFYLLMIFLERRKIWTLIIIVVIAALSIISDKLFIITFILPSVIVLIALIIQNKLQWKEFSKAIIFILSGLILGIFFFHFIKNNSVFEIPKVKSHISFDQLLKSFLNLTGVFNYWFNNVFTVISLAVALIGFILSIVVSFKAEEIKTKAFSLFISLYTLIVLFAPVFTGQFTDLVATRYNISSIYIAILTSWLFLLFLKINTGKAYLTLTTLFALSFLFIALNPGFKKVQKGFHEFIDYYPQESRAIDSLAGKHKIKSGIANYWTARRATLFSKKSVEVLPVFRDFTKIKETNNKKAYIYPNGKRFNFIISNKLTDKSSVMDAFGNNIITENYFEYTIYLTPEFYYIKNNRTPQLK